MKIGLYNIDSKMPNIALMKISAGHKKHGYTVAWCSPVEFSLFDKIYASSIFTYSDKSYVQYGTICGGTGFDIKSELPKKIDDCEPDYSLYPDFKRAIGFLTRGCIRKCTECFVPEKEGYIRPYRDIETVAQGRNEIILLDNNVLACEHGLKQIEKIIELGLKVDFNQGLDARLIDDSIAKLLSEVKWLSPLRMACDNLEMIEPVRKATELLRWNNCKPRRFQVYVLSRDVESTLTRVKFLKGMNLDPFVQPYINKHGDLPRKELRLFARFVNKREIFKQTTWEEYRYRIEKFEVFNDNFETCTAS